MNLKTFKEIKHLLPKKSWAYERNQKNKAEFDDELVIHISENLEIENLDLDRPFNDFINDKNKIIFLILVEGNLIAKNIYNEETDGSTGLTVLGDVVCDNMVVGGQEIYITKNLFVKEVFWGHYNHGTLHVLGNISSKVFVATEEYHYNYEKTNITSDYFICDYDEEVDEETFNPHIPKGIFVPEALMDLDEIDEEDIFGWDSYLFRGGFIDLLIKNQSVLNSEIKILTAQEIENQLYESIPKPFLFNYFNSESEFQNEIQNFNQLMNLLSDEEPEQYFRSEELKATIYLAKQHQRKSDGRKVDLAITVLVDDGMEIYIWRKQINPLKALINKNEPLIVFYKHNKKGIRAPKKLFNNLELLPYINKIWQEILKTANLGLYYLDQLQEVVKPNAILEILEYPVIKNQYNDYWDNGDKNGFWYGNYALGFRLNGAKKCTARVDIGIEVNGDEFDVRKYMFQTDSIKNPIKVILKYLSSQEGITDDRYSNECQTVWLWHWQYYKEALDWYPKIKLGVEEENKSFLDKLENEKPLSEKSNQQLLKKLREEIFLNDALFGNRIVRLTYHDFFKETEKQEISFSAINFSTNVIWNDNKTKGFGFNVIEDVFTQLVILIPNNPKNGSTEKFENCELFIYHFNQEKDSLFLYHIPNSSAQVVTQKLSDYLVTEKSTKEVLIKLIELFEECTHFFDAKADEHQKQKIYQPRSVPFETVIFNNTSFKVINRHQANEVIGELTDLKGEKIYNVFEDTWRFPDNEENAFFLLVEEDIEIEKLELEYSTDDFPDLFILGFIFTKNVTVTSHIVAYDTDNSPALIILGKVIAKNISLFGNVFYFGNGLQCESIIGEYNHGELYVKGETSVSLVYADDMRLHFERFISIQAIINISRPDTSILAVINFPDGKQIYVENYLPSTHYLADIVKDEYINTNEHGEQKLIDDYLNVVFNANLSFIDLNKLSKYTYANFPKDYEKILKQLKQNKTFKKEKSVTHSTNFDYQWYQFISFDHEGTDYLQIGHQLVSYKILMRALYNTATKETTLLLEYEAEEENDGSYTWSGGLTDNNLELWCVKHAIYEVFKRLQ